MSLSNLTLLVLAIMILILSIIKAGVSSMPDKDYEYNVIKAETLQLKKENILLKEQVLLYESFTHIHKEAVDNFHMIAPTIIFLH